MTSSYRPWSKFNRYTWSILYRRRQPLPAVTVALPALSVYDGLYEVAV
jgi:hypothetical protein